MKEYILYGTLRVRKVSYSRQTYYISLSSATVKSLGLDKYIGKRIKVILVVEDDKGQD